MRRDSVRKFLAGAPGAREIGDRGGGDQGGCAVAWQRRCAVDCRQRS